MRVQDKKIIISNLQAIAKVEFLGNLLCLDLNSDVEISCEKIGTDLKEYYSKTFGKDLSLTFSGSRADLYYKNGVKAIAIIK